DLFSRGRRRKMHSIPCFLSASCCLILLVEVQGKEDTKSIQGVWRVISFEQEGKKPIPADKLKDMAYVFLGNKIAMKYNEKVALEGTFKLYPDTKPKSIDLIYEKETERGIYKLEKGVLTICATAFKTNKVRPSQFATKAGSRTMLIVLERQ